MGWKITRIGCLLLALIAAPVTALYAQDGFDPEQQAALDSAQRAVDNYFALQTYTAEHTQTLVQEVGVSLGAEAVTIDQQIEQQGTTTTERQPDNRFDNQAGAVNQTITQTITGTEAGQEMTQSITQMLELIILDDRAYLRVSIDDPLFAGLFPEGWQDVTEGAADFPGMELFDIEQLLTSSSSEYTAEMFDVLFGAVVEIELLEAETVGADSAQRVRLVMNPAVAFSGEGASGLRGMFRAASLPFDIDGVIDLIATDADTHYEITLLFGGESDTLYGYDVILNMDITIPGELVTEPTLSGAEVSLAQQSTSGLRFTNLNEPANISAPPLEETETEG